MSRISDRIETLWKKQWVRVAAILIGLICTSLFGKWAAITEKRRADRCIEEVELLRSEVLLLTTKQLNTERELEKVQEKTLLVATAMDDNSRPRWIKDRQGVIVWINEAYEEFFNVKFEFIVGTQGQTYYGPEEVAEFLRNDSIVMNNMKGQSFVEATSSGDKGWTTVITTKLPVINHGVVMGTKGEVEVRYSNSGEQLNPLNIKR